MRERVSRVGWLVWGAHVTEGIVGPAVGQHSLYFPVLEPAGWGAHGHLLTVLTCGEHRGPPVTGPTDAGSTRTSSDLTASRHNCLG